MSHNNFLYNAPQAHGRGGIFYDMEKKIRVGIQGVAGCFHDAAAREYFGGYDVETVEFDTFPELFEALHYDASLLGIAATKTPLPAG